MPEPPEEGAPAGPEGGAEEAGTEEAGAEEREQLRRDHAALLYDLCSLKAKFELTLETLRSILKLGINTTWADILEHVEALALQSGDGGAAVGIPLLVSDAELERDRLQESLEAQTAYSARLRELLQKQQVLLDMTAQQLEGQHDQDQPGEEQHPSPSRKDAALVDECEALRCRVQEQQDALASQEGVICGQARRIAEAEAELRRERDAAAARAAEERQRQTEAERQRAEQERLRGGLERQRAEIKELVGSVADRDELVERLRVQLQVHEAAERRRHSYHPSTRALGEDSVWSVCVSPTGSTRPSARGPRTKAAEHDVAPGTSRSQAPTVSHSGRASPIDGMDKDERNAFLSHFPLASRTERHLRDSMDDRKRRQAAASAALQ
mmetsp:Transcript_91647/g.259578  ORF Transcript_91647/g.259578 Transcript_91647/m.259578 type:complete len:383 (-) Transcript_91647:90-1238(-)